MEDPKKTTMSRHHQHRSEQFRELEKLKQDMLQARGWLLPQSIQDLLVEWFVEKGITENNKQSPKIVAIRERYTQYKKQEPIVQFELSLWKMACLLNPPTLNNNTSSNNGSNNKYKKQKISNNDCSSNNNSSNDKYDAVDYFVRGGWKKNKSALRHDSMIGIVMTNVLPFLAKIDYEISSARADYYLDNNISTVIVSNAGFEGVNGIYTKQNDTVHNDARLFTKPGTYDGHAVTYSIYNEHYADHRPNEVVWHISILPNKNEDPRDAIDIDFYFNSCDYDDYKEIPPTDNWILCDEQRFEQGTWPPPLIIPLKK